MSAPLSIIDVDSHVVEPLDLWTSRVSKKWGDQVPHVEWDDKGQELRWKVGDIFLSGVGEYCSAGWPEHFPSHPPTLEEADPACYDAAARLKRLDEYGVWAQVLYPNIIAFDSHAFLTKLGPELALECVRAYNDFLTDFASVDPRRLVPVAMLPYWDVDATIAEMHRVKDTGHKGVIFAALFERLGLPNITKPMWEPVLATAQDLELSLNFHIGFAQREGSESEGAWNALTKTSLDEYTNRLSFVRKSGPSFASSAAAVSDIIISGVCHKFPRLNFVTVESGFGYFPYLLEKLDWLWQTSGAAHEYPDREPPSFYFRRQIYATFWFEKYCVPLLEEFQDNVMFETDFPHETSLSPGPASPAVTARETVEQNLSSLKPEVLQKVVHDNAARVYHLT